MSKQLIERLRRASMEHGTGAKLFAEAANALEYQYSRIKTLGDMYRADQEKIAELEAQLEKRKMT